MKKTQFYNALTVLSNEHLLDEFGEWYLSNYEELKSSNQLNNDWIREQQFEFKELLQHLYKHFRYGNAVNWLEDDDQPKWLQYVEEEENAGN